MAKSCFELGEAHACKYLTTICVSECGLRILPLITQSETRLRFGAMMYIQEVSNH